MEQPKRRGRPRKNDLIKEKLGVADSSSSIMNEIENAKFDFIQSISTPEVKTYNPLGESVVERDYSSPTIAEGLTMDIEEPKFKQETFSNPRPQENNQFGQDPFAEQEPSFQKQGRGGVPNESISNDPLTNINPQFNELEEKEKTLASEQLVETLLDGFETLHQIPIKYAKVNEDTIRDLIMQGQIDQRATIPINEYESVPVQVFFNQFNSQVEDALAPDPTFRKKVKKPLVNIFKKRGWGMSDEQFVMFATAQYVFTKGLMFKGLRDNGREIINMLQADMMRKQEQMQPPQAPPQQQSRPSTPPPPQPSPAQNYQYEQVQVEDVDDLMRQMAETNARAMGTNEDEDFDIMNPNPMPQPEPEPDFIAGEKYYINNEDNPLREKRPDVDLTKNVKVEEKFEKGKPTEL
jgi:hypothetical protein